MRVSALLAVLPLALAAPATDSKRSIPELDVAEWNDIQSTFVDRVWNGLTGWSWNKAEEIIGSTADEGQTIFKQLKADEQFSKIVKAIEFARIEDKFDNPKLHFTFFAPNNDALKPPPGFPHHHHDHHHHEHDLDALLAELERSPSLTTVASLLDSDSSLLKEGGDDDDKEKERRKEIFRKIVTKILGYHVIKTAPYTAAKLAENSTVATALKAEDGSFAGLHRRIKIVKELVPPAVVLNFYAKVISADNKASNGIYHVINHPLIPPPSIFDDLYIATDFFSTLVQATYGLDGVKYGDYHYDKEASKPGHPKFTGTPLATVFAPTNAAFHALPGPLKFFLFSPFGEHALAKTLAYHYIPETLLLSELLVDQRKHKHADADAEAEVEYFALGDDPSFHKEFDIHPKLPNSTLHIVVDKTKVLPVEGAVKTTIKVNDQYTLAVDVQARNGAFHPLGKLLVPPHHHHDEHGVDIAHLDTWENWEEWVPAFAAEPLAL